jgi:hypothetical protein
MSRILEAVLHQAAHTKFTKVTKFFSWCPVAPSARHGVALVFINRGLRGCRGYLEIRIGTFSSSVLSE